MRNTDYFKNKKVTIVGFARSGLTAANLLYDLGAKVSVTDNKDNETTRLNAAKLKSKEICFELGGHNREVIQNSDFVILSPGVPAHAQPVVWAKEFGVRIISEIELAYILCPATIIAVTGSNGKTTTTILISKVLEASGRKVWTCGNIGNPFSGEVQKMAEGDYVCLEVSSFQLETIDKFKPKISVILNFSRNHLDWYSNMQEYLDAKARIFLNQEKEDYLVLNRGDAVLRDLAKKAKAKIAFFEQEQGFNSNQSAVIAVGNILGIKKEAALKVFQDFKGVEHRQECVARINGIKFINDSKATTVESAMWALESILEPIIWIAGGRDKGLDYSLIRDLALRKVKNLILIGEAKEKIRKVFDGALSMRDANTLEEAVGAAFRGARPGDAVLLSPMCSSYDMFKDYEERGRQFKEIVFKLAQKRGIENSSDFCVIASERK
ncbi:MAG: UDP-N-acetylmuramoyl-L-alanine--D-glutamate ligase [Candidatus Omnitrophota bacterium]